MVNQALEKGVSVKNMNFLSSVENDQRDEEEKRWSVLKTEGRKEVNDDDEDKTMKQVKMSTHPRFIFH